VTFEVFFPMLQGYNIALNLISNSDGFIREVTEQRIRRPVTYKHHDGGGDDDDDYDDKLYHDITEHK
jgi:hypothetical protein